MANRSAEEAEKNNIELMGETLGRQYSLLWQEVVAVHAIWGEYEELFGTSSERVALLNRAARWFFHLIQEELWTTTLLRIARLTDPPTTGKKANLTIQNLPELVDDSATKARVEKLVLEVLDATVFCRDWRNRWIAHRDLPLALKEDARPLEAASRIQVTQALKAIAAAINAVQFHFKDGETHFEVISSDNAVSLLYILDDGLRAREQRLERIRSGTATKEDLAPRRKL
ncbi:MAG TPA: hypothetical protein VF601_05605 [Beijerinckiaceae bacterium]